MTDTVHSWADKTQLVWTRVPDFLDMFPNGKVIHIVRDPRNVMASFKKSTYAPEPAYISAAFNCYDSMKKGLFYRDNYDEKIYQIDSFSTFIPTLKYISASSGLLASNFSLKAIAES